MPQLYFRFGTMSSAKTANLLMAVHNHRKQDKKVVAIKPSIDNRFGNDNIKSRAIEGIIADIILYPNDTEINLPDDVKYVYVDECQFLSEYNVIALRALTKKANVYCYGLRTDYAQRLFPGSATLFRYADVIEELESECTICSNKAIVNAKITDGHVISSGTTDPELDSGEKYKAMCWNCWHNMK